MQSFFNSSKLPLCEGKREIYAVDPEGVEIFIPRLCAGRVTFLSCADSAVTPTERENHKM
jgi:hypothetical protein